MNTVNLNRRLHTLCAGLLLLAAAGLAGAGDLYVVCNAGVALQATEVRDVFLGEKGFAGTVRLVPADNSASQAAFLEKVMKLDAAKYNGLWTKKSFRDGATPPTVKGGDAEALTFVKQTPGACSYLSSAPGGGVTVIGKF